MLMFLMLFFTLLFIVIVHELGHAYVMSKHRVYVLEFGIGFKVPGVKYLRAKIISAETGKIRYFVISPILLGAYVLPSALGEITMEKLLYREKADIYGGGVFANLILCLLFLVCYCVYALPSGWPMLAYIVLLICLILGLWFGRKYFSAYILPLLSILILGLMAVEIFADPTGAVAGPIGLFQLGNDKITGFENYFLFTALISLGLALFNALPVYPLDGGHIIMEIFRNKIGEKFESAYKYVSLAIIGLIMLLAFWGDIARIMG